MANVKDISFNTIADSIKNGAADLLSSSDFISRTIGMNNSYEDIMFIVQSLGREPISLLGKDYAFIYDHVRRNYLQGTYVHSKLYGDNADGDCYKFTFYKEVPTVKFADPYNDPMNLLDRWVPEFTTQTTMGNKATIHYSESNDGYTNNKYIDDVDDLDSGNPGVATPGISSYGPTLTTCDLVKKTNDNFNHGKYQTLVARFHTNADESKSQNNPTQTANSPTYGMSHGRNLLKKFPTTHNGYDNPYCRVWTYHHQYNQIARQIRPFGDENGEVFTQENLEKRELTGVGAETVGFRTVKNESYGFDSGSKRLDNYGVLNYRNGTVNIAPTAKIKDYFDGKQNDYDKQIIATKKCMFSIENLAWRDDKVRMDEFDAYGLSPEQKGPLGGRIMWFPPYDLTFNEDVSVKWNTNDFIGRGESVYTYTNTERRGNLSFTLLIDHPAILDYWTGHERNGMKNKGVHLDPGNSGGIDNKNNQENTLLRFFAGCDILTAKPQDYRIRSVKPEITLEPQEPKEPAPKEPDEVKEKVKKKICAIVYYPNNYSGVDDNGGIGSDDEGKVNPIYYLMNGVGAQKEIVYRSASKNYETIDLGTNITSDDGVGYEMSTNALDGGISLITWDRIKDETYYGVVNKEDPPQFKKNNGVNEYILNTIPYGGKNIVLGKQIGKSASKGTDTKSIASKWKQKRWFYRVDKAYQEQVFSRPQSYIDGNSYGLNAKGFGKVRQHSNVIKNFGLEEDSDIYKLVSFADVFVAFEGEENNVVSSKATEANVKLVKDVFENKEKYSNIKISFNGHASFQGYSSSNNTLATNRALTLRRWLSSFKETDGAEFGEPKVINQPREVKKDTGELDDEMVKIWRSASIVIEYEEENVTNAATAETPRAISGDSGNTIYQQDRVEIKNKETSSSYIDFISNLGSVQGTNGKTLAETAWETMGEINGKNYTDPNNWENYDDSFLHRDDFKQSVVKRYDNEGEFFEALTEESPFLHHLISEKIKYFDPAYHSISPEGFNARLTFLHQCTRQGSTVESSSFEQESTAYNLAFGRPPVCVLRLGDFYYTKIIITSLNIQYENAQWDMNPEGIGMMPMFAKVTINFNFLGGSDLAGPIARLQNAVSFNYYANTSVYDNRAEKVEYEPNGSGKEIKFKGFHYPNIYVGDRLNQGMIGKKKEDGTIYAEDF